MDSGTNRVCQLSRVVDNCVSNTTYSVKSFFLCFIPIPDSRTAVSPYEWSMRISRSDSNQKEEASQLLQIVALIASFSTQSANPVCVCVFPHAHVWGAGTYVHLLMKVRGQH